MWLVGLLGLVVATLLNSTPSLAEAYIYDDIPANPIPFDDVSTAICNEPFSRTFAVTDSFLVNSVALGFNADHLYRSDIRLVLESPKGTRLEVVVEFDMTPEDANKNYDILLDDDATDPLDDGTNDNTGAPYFERSVKPTSAFAIFSGEQAKGTWTLEICDAGVEDDGAYNRSRLVFDGTPVPDGPQADTIRGFLFRDYNADGRHQPRAEAGIAGITVTAYGDAGDVISSTVTDAAGEYVLDIPNGTAVRLELDNLPNYLQPGPAGADSLTTVTFVTSPAENVNIGLANPAQYAQSSAEMRVALPRFAYGAHDGPNAELATFLAYHEDDGSHAFLQGDDIDTTVYDASATALAQHRETGAIWGTAYDRLHNQLLAAAFVKRHTDLGPTQNPTTIYRLDPDAQAVQEWLTLDPARANPHGTNVDWVEDFAVYAAVGMEGWGDLDLSDDFRTLYGIDLGTRTLVQIPIAEDGSAGLPTIIDPMPQLEAELVGSAAEQCPTLSDLRPFGLGMNDGVLYLGVVCSAASTVPANALPIQAPTKNVNRASSPGDFSKLRAYVFAWDGNVATPLFTNVLDFPLRYPRGCASYNQQADCGVNYPGEWLPWVNNFPYSSDGTSSPAGAKRFESFYPQPLVSNIEFYNGSMVLYLMDRFGHQVGPFTQSPYGEELDHVAAHSDILFACQRAEGWVMESVISGDEACRTGIRAYIRGEERANEYFAEDTYRARFALHGDVGFGAGVAIPGRETVIHAVFDPIYAVDGRGDTLFDGGLHWYSVADGHWRKSLRIYNNITGILPDEGIFSKANGLGDLVALTDIPPIEIGNRVWLDDNRDGIQSPLEPGIADVTVELLCPAVGPDGIAGNADDATVIAVAQTNEEGIYYFSSATGTTTEHAHYGLTLVSGAACVVRLPNASGANQQVPLRTLQLTEANDQNPTASGTDQNDSDALLTATSATIELIIGAPGHNNHTYDFGFVEPTDVRHSLGNQVWFDVNNNARIDNNEPGIDSVALTLFATQGTTDPADDRQVGTTTTANGGLYLFSYLPAGDYYVQLDSSNFGLDGPLAGCRSSDELLDEDFPNLDVDHNDNGMLVANVVRSGVVTLGDNEPRNEAPDNDSITPDERENLTVDFGCYLTVSLGNRVWLDDGRDGGLADNGLLDGGEVGLSGVVLALLNGNKEPLYRTDGRAITTTTDLAGYYLFTDLLPGEYVVQVLPSNFQPNGVLAGYRSSSSTEEDPNDDQDTNDNGIDGATPAVDGICSNVVTLTYATEPGQEPDPGQLPDRALDSNSNLTVDFGFVTQPSAIEEEAEPVERYRLFVPWVTG